MNRSFLLMIALLLGLSAGLASPKRAEACSVPSSAIHVRDVPANGVVLMEIRCGGSWSGFCYQSTLPSELPVVDLTTSQPVPGTIVHQNGAEGTSPILIAFKPDAPLIEGRLYEVMWQPETEPSADVDYVFEALAATPMTAETVAVEVDLSMYADQLYEFVLCTNDDSIGSCSSNEAISLRAKWYPQLSAAIDSDTIPAGSEGQVVVTMALWAEGQEPPAQTELVAYRDHTLATSQQFDAKAAAYCYRVEITSLIDDSFVRHQDCIEHGALGELVEAPIAEGSIIRRLGMCSAPPDGLLREWCIGKRERCAETDDRSPSCASVAETCTGAAIDAGVVPPTMQEPDGSVPDDDWHEPIADAGGDSDEGDDLIEPGDRGDQAEPGGEPEVTPGGPTSSGSSCAVRDGRSSGEAIGAWLALTALAFAMRRVRKDASV